jgi:nucleoside-diphosphate-sugar epimerase
VRAVVRSADKGEALKKTYPQYQDKLETVVVENIELPDAYDQVVQGVDTVIHMASPIPRPGLDNETGILKPAKAGILNMLSAAKAAPSVKRVVTTSSSVAVMDKSLPRSARYDLYGGF